MSVSLDLCTWTKMLLRMNYTLRMEKVLFPISSPPNTLVKNFAIMDKPTWT